MTACPRFWYLSITAIWSEADNFSSLKSCLEGRRQQFDNLPFHHIRIPSECWHSSLFAMAKVTEFPSGTTAALHVEEVFQEFLTFTGLVKQLRGCFKPFSVQPAKLKCFDSGTTVEFKENYALSALRNRFRCALLRPFESVARNRRGIESLLQDEKKSRGPKFFGSIARSPHRADQSALRWEKDLPDLEPLKFKGAYFLVSDEALMNPHGKTNFTCIGRVGWWGKKYS
jgi:hypothetical protein